MARYHITICSEMSGASSAIVDAIIGMGGLLKAQLILPANATNPIIRHIPIAINTLTGIKTPAKLDNDGRGETVLFICNIDNQLLSA